MTWNHLDVADFSSQKYIVSITHRDFWYQRQCTSRMIRQPQMSNDRWYIMMQYFIWISLPSSQYLLLSFLAQRLEHSICNWGFTGSSLTIRRPVISRFSTQLTVDTTHASQHINWIYPFERAAMVRKLSPFLDQKPGIISHSENKNVK